MRSMASAVLQSVLDFQRDGRTLTVFDLEDMLSGSVLNRVFYNDTYCRVPPAVHEIYTRGFCQV